MRLRIAFKVEEARMRGDFRHRWVTFGRAGKRIDRWDRTDDKRRGLRPMTSAEALEMMVRLLSRIPGGHRRSA